MTQTDPNRYEVTYTPLSVGNHHIEVLQDGVAIDGNQYTSRVFDINKVIVSDFPATSIVDSPTYFLIDATDSGSGNLEISISINERNVPNYVQNEGGARFRVKFLPDQAGVYSVQMKFNGFSLPGSPYLCKVYSSEFTFENYEYASIHKRTSFLIKPKASQLSEQNIHADILNPSGEYLDGKIEEKAANIYVLRFLPTDIGDHQIIFYRDRDKKTMLTKFISHVYDATKIQISDLPPASPHQLYKFSINTSEAGNGHLVVKIKQNDVRLSHEQVQIVPHIYEISFLPELAIQCSVQIVFNGENNFGTLTIPMINDVKQIRLSPIATGIVGQTIQFTIDAIDAKPVSVIITESHAGRVVPHSFTSLPNEKNRYRVAFTPTVARQHAVLVSYDNQPISTTSVDVFDLKKIRVSPIEDGLVGKPVVFTVDTHGAGEGHLEVTISDGQRTLPAELKSIQARKFDIGFLPEASGKYSISIAFNGISVEGSPFEIQIHDSSITDEEEDDDEEEEEEEEDDELNDNHEFLIGGQLEGTKVGELAWLICDTPLSEVYEDFDLFITDPEQSIIKHTRIQDSAGRWRIEFEPLKSGIYQIQTNEQGNDQSALILASMDILPIDYQRVLEGERVIHPNVTNDIVLRSHKSNPQIRLRRSNGDEVPIEIEKNGESSEWKVSFTLMETDYYQFSLAEEDRDEQIYDIHCLAEEMDLFRNGGLDDITRLIVDQSKINGNDVNVIVKDPLAHTIPAAFYRNSERDLVIEYVPTKLDIHEVFIRTQNNLLDICPIRINSFGANQAFEPVLRVQVKEVLEHTFDGIHDDEEKLQIEIIDPFERLLPFQRLTNERGELKLALSPVRVGTHWIRVTNNDSQNFALLPVFAFDDDYVPLSPVQTPSPASKSNQDKSSNLPSRDLLTVSEGSDMYTSRTETPSSSLVQNRHHDPSPNESSIDGRESPEAPVLDITDLNDPGVRIVSKFSFKDAENQLQITIYDAEKNVIQYKLEHLLDGRKRIFYEPTVVGPVEIHIRKEEQPIDGSPLIVHAFDPAAVHLLELPEKIVAETVQRFLIDPGKAGKGSLKIAIRDPKNRSLPIQVLKRSNGQVAVEFEPTASGPHTITVLFNRIAIPETPLRVHVEAKELEQERARSLATQTSLDPLHSRLSKSNENLLQASEPQRTERVTKSEDRNLVPSNLNDGQIQRYQMLKERFEKHLPIDTVFDPRRYPFKILSQQPYPVINVDVHLLIDLPHVAYVHIYINGMEIPIQAVRRNDDTFLLKFRPTVAGNYSIILKDFLEQPLSGCPYLFPVYNPQIAHIESFNRLQAITDCHLICNVDRAGPGKIFIMVFVQNQNSEEFQPITVPIQIQSRPGNRICISFNPPSIGIYRVYLAYRNLPIHGTPIDVIVYDVRRISIIPESDQPAAVRTPISYRVNTSQAGQGQLKVELAQPATASQPCRCQIQEINPQEYRIQYLPNEPGRYQLRILFNQELLQGKTFDTDVHPFLPQIRNVRIQQIQPTQPPEVGSEICLQINTENTPPASIQCQLSSNGSPIPHRIERTPDSAIWHLKFRPYTSGTYQLSLTANGSSLLSSPYQIQVNDSPNDKVLLSGLEQTLYTNSPCVIQVHAESASTAQIRVVVLLGTRQIPSTTGITNDNLVRIQFIPQEPGLYSVHVSCANLPIEGSPFSIRVERPRAVQISGECFHRLRLNDLGIFRIHCQQQRGPIQARIHNLSAGDRADLGQSITFQLHDPYEQFLHFPLPVLFNTLAFVLSSRLKLSPDRIRNLSLGKENGRTMVSFQLHELPLQTPSNEQIIHHLRHSINHQTINLLDPNRCVLKTVLGSVTVGRGGN